MELRPGSADQRSTKAISISVETSMTNSRVLGSTKIYVKPAPTDGSNIDSCDYKTDIAKSQLASSAGIYLSPSEAVETATGKRTLGTFVGEYPLVASSLCWVRFVMSLNTRGDITQT